MKIKAEWIELVEAILFDDSIKGDKAKKNITTLSAELLIAVSPLIAKAERERIVALFDKGKSRMKLHFSLVSGEEQK